MKTNHRRENKGTYTTGFNYGQLMCMKLIQHGCSPTYQSRVGAAAAIRGRKKKDERERRHAADHAVRQEALSLGFN